MELQMRAICAGTATRNDVVQQNLEQYRAVFMRTAQQMNVLKTVSGVRCGCRLLANDHSGYQKVHSASGWMRSARAPWLDRQEAAGKACSRAPRVFAGWVPASDAFATSMLATRVSVGWFLLSDGTSRHARDCAVLRAAPGAQLGAMGCEIRLS
jgi:hypothetical protein